jgi:hypothetical protein
VAAQGREQWGREDHVTEEGGLDEEDALAGHAFVGGEDRPVVEDERAGVGLPASAGRRAQPR